MSDLAAPLISIVIPTFNRANVIHIPLESIFNQTYTNFDVIVVDDASTDNTEEVVERFDDPRISYIRHSKNLKGSVARNTGIKSAKGEYVAFLDSDDAWVPKKLELQLDLIAQQERPNKVVSYTKAFQSRTGINKETYHSFDERFFFPKRGKAESESLSDYLFCGRGKTLTSTLMIHRSLAMKTLFDESLKKHQDWDFCLRLEANGAIFEFIDQPLTIWNGDPNLDHVGRLSDYQLSEIWFECCQEYLSERAAKTFLIEKLLPHWISDLRKRLHAQKLIWDSVLMRKNSLMRSLKLTSQLWI